MPPKRKASIPPNAASARNYTDVSGDAPNKRSRIAKPLSKAFADSAPPIDSIARNTENGAPGEAVKKEEEESEGEFDHSRPEERAGIVDRRYYPAEMSNERCALYNANEIPRPIEILAKTLESTKDRRTAIREANKAQFGDAVVHWFKRDLRIRDNTGLSQAAQLAKAKGVGVIGVWFMSPQDWEAHLVSPPKCDFELRSVESLKQELEEFDIPLHVETIRSEEHTSELQSH